jgi:hypothetical protein
MFADMAQLLTDALIEEGIDESEAKDIADQAAQHPGDWISSEHTTARISALGFELKHS